MIFIHNDKLLSTEECDRIIELASGIGLVQATVTSNDAEGNPVRAVGSYRTNHNLRMSYGKDKLIDDIYKRISDIVCLPIENIEMEANKYHLTEYFMPHYDFLPPEWIVDTGGQRLYSSVVYLNDDFEGGQTNFPNIPYMVQPLKGNAIVWRNCIENTTVLEHKSLHESVPVTNGIKWALIIWVRESAYVAKHFQTTS